jgi:hypothetical protein
MGSCLASHQETNTLFYMIRRRMDGFLFDDVIGSDVMMGSDDNLNLFADMQE